MNVYECLGISTIINAAGTLTTLGGSLMPPEVTDAVIAASRSFVRMDELHAAAGEYVAKLLGVEGAHICGSASAGIALMAAGCMAGADQERISRLPDTAGMRDKFIVQKSHRNPFDQAIRVAGGQFIEIEADEKHLTEALEDEIAAVYYTFAWFCAGEALPLSVVTGISHRAGVPVIVDAAAEVPPRENFSRFLREGADLVVFSGGKAVRGPQASGLLLGRKDLVEACRLSDCPHMSVGRTMKAGKEEIVGLVRALELYLATDESAEMALWERRVAHIIKVLSGLERVRAWRQLPYGVGQQIPHVALDWDEEALGLTHRELTQKLLDGQPRIGVQLVSPESYRFAGFLQSQVRIHPHTLCEGEEIIVARRVQEELIRACQSG